MNRLPNSIRKRLRTQRPHGLFLLAFALLAVQRLWELRVSDRHAAAMLRQGGREHVPQQYQIMKFLHTSWFVAMLLEILLLRRRPHRPLLALSTLLFAVGQALRYAAIRTLGERWTARVVTVPGAPPVTRGIYRHLSHPNYLGVALEIAAFPLLHSAAWTALVYSLANLLLLRARIRAEEQALVADNSYDACLPPHRPQRAALFGLGGLRPLHSETSSETAAAPAMK